MALKSSYKVDTNVYEIEVTVAPEEFTQACKDAYLKRRKSIQLPGFRKGKATQGMIEKLYGAGVFYSDAVDIALPEAYTQAIGQSGLDVVGYPEIEIVDDKIDENGFTFKATVAVYPEVKLGEYKGLTAEKEEIKVSADDVKERLNEMAERNARLVSVDRKAKKGDIAVIDIEGFDNGEAGEGGKGENYELELGSGSFVPGFEDQVIGMKAGEEKDLDITFPEDYHKDLAGKKVSIGAAGSGVYFNAIDVLSAYDLKESDISAVYQSFGDSAESLKDGKIDAAFIVAGAPATAITDLATAGSVSLVSLDDSHVQSLLSASPYYTAATIKAGTY